MGQVELRDGAILKVTAVRGSTTEISVITGTQEPFDKTFKSDIIVSGSIIQNAGANDYPAFEVIQGTSNDNQTILNNTITKITFGTENYDLGSNFNLGATNRFTAPQRGIYQFYGKVLYNSSTVLAANDSFALYFYKNGSITSAGKVINPGETTRTGFKFQTIYLTINLAKGDYIELFASQVSGATLYTYSTGVGSEWTSLQGALIAATGD
jgi:hypothetical protein